MSYPPGYDPSPLYPKITIRDMAGTARYTYVHPALGAPRDLDAESFSIRVGTGTDHGAGELVINDRTNKLTDRDNPRRPCIIRPGWEVTVELGKSAANLHRWFTGVVSEPEVSRPGTAQQTVILHIIGYGILLAYVFGSIDRRQKLLADGITPDPADRTTRIRDLFKAILTSPDIPIVGTAAPPITVPDAEIDDIPITLPDFHRHHNSLALMLADIAATAGAVYGIAPDKSAYLYLPASRPSGLLIANDLDDYRVRNWNQSKIMYMRDDPYSYLDSAIDGGYTTIHGLGAQHETIDWNPTDANATLDLSARTIAIPFRPAQHNIGRVELHLARRAVTPDRANLTMHIVGAHRDNTAAPDVEDVRYATLIGGGRIERDLPAPPGSGYFDIHLGRENAVEVTHGETLFVILSKYESVGNATIDLDYQTAVAPLTAANTYYDSDDNGATWTQRLGVPRIRTHSTRTVDIVIHNTEAAKRFRPKTAQISLLDYPEKKTAIAVLEGLSVALGRARRMYTPIRVSAPDTPPKLGQTSSIRDRFSGLDAPVTLIGYDVSATAETDAMATPDITIHAEDWH